MSLRQELLSLVQPLSPGEELCAGARLEDASEELGAVLVFSTAAGRLYVHVSRREDDPKAPVHSDALAFSYRANGAQRGTALALSVCRAVAELARRNEAELLRRLERAAQGPAKLREVRVDTALEARDGDGEGGPHYVISPYVGCLVGCSFCYAQTPLRSARRLFGAPEVPWGSWVDVRTNVAEVLARELKTLPPAPIKFCPVVSDPYQAPEARYGLTAACLAAIREAGGAAAGWVPAVLTRMALVTRDAQPLAACGGWAGISVPTLDDEVRRVFEPRATPIPERLGVLRTLREAGVRTFALIQPFLPGPVEELADALATLTSSVSLRPLDSLEGAASLFRDPRFAEAATPQWQQQRERELREALTRRGVTLWSGELPPAPSGTPA